MAEEIDDNDFFQQDFTTASEWEIFNARLDEIFLDWKLPYATVQKCLDKNELISASWQKQTQSVFFADVEMLVTHYKAEIEHDDKEEQPNADNEKLLNENQQKICQSHIDLMSLNNNFCSFESSKSLHPITVWYGLREFVVIEVANESLISESQLKVLLSSACISVNESNTEIPVFIRALEKHLDVFLGVCESPSIRVNFDIVALEQTPPTCRYLSGLLCMFKGKIKATYIKPVTVSVQLTYSLTEFANCEFFLKCKIPFSAEIEENTDAVNLRSEGAEFCVLPYGVSIDPIKELILHCTWQEIAENVIVDSLNYSDLNPMLAPLWSINVNVKSKMNAPIYYLTDALEEFLRLHDNKRNLENILGHVSNSLQLDGPLKPAEMIQMLAYMFPNAESPKFFYQQVEEKETVTFNPLKVKTALADSLIFRLASLLATVNMYFSGLSAVAQVWSEFINQIRRHVEKGVQIPGVGDGNPDYRSCLLHQKLQMLNICMERRRARAGDLPFAMASQHGKSDEMLTDDEDDDEFYDCDVDDNRDAERHELWNKPEGRLKQLDKLTLIGSDEALYIPITQDPVHKTEDQISEYTEVMLHLGPDSEFGAQVNASLLYSDMSSFKAANPSGKLEDFIRWYSPRDWIVETNDEGEAVGQLSQRMQIPDNTWQKVWSNAKPVPAKRQTGLFNDKKETEEILKFLETRTIAQICELTLPTLFHAAILKLQDELSNSKFPEFFQPLQAKLMENVCKLSREPWQLTIDPPTCLVPSPKKWEIFLNDIMKLESGILHARSIIQKIFPTAKTALTDNQKSILQELLQGANADLTGGARNPISVEVLNLFSDSREAKNEFNTNKEAPSQLFLPEPVRKEYILRVDGKTTSKGIGGPQFLRAILDKHMRLCGAFSENTTFV